MSSELKVRSRVEPGCGVDLRDLRAPATPDELADFETDVLAGFVLARASAGLADGTISGDVNHLEQVRAWFGKPLWDMEPADADAYFGQVLRAAAEGTRLGRAQALTTFFAFLELRHKVEIHAMTGRFVECPIDEMNKPRGRKQAALRIPLTEAEVKVLFAGWREELTSCRKFGPTAQLCCSPVDVTGRAARERGPEPGLADIKWELGRFGKLHVRIGKGAPGAARRERMVPLINGADERCAGSSRTCGAISTTTTGGLVRRCSRRSARTPTAPAAGWRRRPSRRPRRGRLHAPTGMGRHTSDRTCCGISRRASFIYRVWT